MLSFDTKNVTMTNRAWLYQSPFVAACAMLTGFLGACFNLLRGWVQVIKPSKRAHVLRILEVAILAAVTVSLMFGVTALAGTCVRPPQPLPASLGTTSWAAAMYRGLGAHVEEEPRKYGIQWHCPEGDARSAPPRITQCLPPPCPCPETLAILTAMHTSLRSHCLAVGRRVQRPCNRLLLVAGRDHQAAVLHDAPPPKVLPAAAL